MIVEKIVIPARLDQVRNNDCNCSVRVPRFHREHVIHDRLDDKTIRLAHHDKFWYQVAPRLCSGFRKSTAGKGISCSGFRKSSGGKEISVVWFDFSGWEKPFPIADEPMRDARRKPPAD